MKETGSDLILILASVEELHVRKCLGLSIRKPEFRDELCYVLRDFEHVTKNPSDSQLPVLLMEVIVSVATVCGSYWGVIFISKAVCN